MKMQNPFSDSLTWPYPCNLIYSKGVLERFIQAGPSTFVPHVAKRIASVLSHGPRLRAPCSIDLKITFTHHAVKLSLFTQTARIKVEIVLVFISLLCRALRIYVAYYAQRCAHLYIHTYMHEIVPMMCCLYYLYKEGLAQIIISNVSSNTRWNRLLEVNTTICINCTAFHCVGLFCIDFF